MARMVEIPLQVIDDLDELAVALGAIADLMNPEEDLHAVSREALTILISLIQRQIMNALEWKKEGCPANAS